MQHIQNLIKSQIIENEKENIDKNQEEEEEKEKKSQNSEIKNDFIDFTNKFQDPTYDIKLGR